MTASASAIPGPTEVVRSAVEALHQRFYEPLEVAALLREAWEGAVAAVARAGVTVMPPTLAYPAEPTGAYARHAETFPMLERLADGRLEPTELMAAAVRELLARRRDGHTHIVTPSMMERWRSNAGPRRDFGLVVTDAPPLTVADAVPGGPAQRAGLHRGQQILTINGQPCAELRRPEAMAQLDRREGATNELTVRHADGRTAAVELRAEPSPLISSQLLPGPFGRLRIDGFAATDEATAELGAALESFEQAGARGWIVDVRWCGGGFSVQFSRLLVDKGHLFARLRHDEARFPDGSLHPVREDLDADGTALPFQRRLVVLVGPGSISGAESFAGPLQALGRARLVGERTAGLCGMATRVDLAPGWAMIVAARETAFGPQERRFNRVGVPPDVVVAPSPEDEAAGRDPQLETALELLRRTGPP
jgi:carboxyl-terminal processing protease